MAPEDGEEVFKAHSWTQEFERKGVLESELYFVRLDSICNKRGRRRKKVFDKLLAFKKFYD